ncbi:hypothetical protein OC846_004744 [Tilletia horrida]|uniref:Uncharacterized protein n=1 Tax=Tilletia horrida TaxID=155126 RepID=A0AAN6GMR5_9BASI|nr:hypothetical protein OC846_004744 [Tilletia horrida]
MPRWSLTDSLRPAPRIHHRATSALANWSDVGLRAFAAVVDDSGHFNGSCPGDPTVESVPSGACAATFSQVTTFCCGAVGGYLKGLTDPSSSSSSNSSSTSANSDGGDQDEVDSQPYCKTTRYRTMLMCYDDLVHESCNLQVSPSGICKSNGTDTSTLSSSARLSSSRRVPAAAAPWSMLRKPSTRRRKCASSQSTGSLKQWATLGLLTLSAILAATGTQAL